MEDADNVRMKVKFSLWEVIVDIQGVGALYIIMDTIRRKRAEQREREEKQKLEEIFHNEINKGRELLKPLTEKWRGKWFFFQCDEKNIEWI